MAETAVTTEEPVLFSIENGIASVTLNRPAKMNALTPEMLVRLDRAWQAIQDDSAVRVAVLGQQVRLFQAGLDGDEERRVEEQAERPGGGSHEREPRDRRQESTPRDAGDHLDTFLFGHGTLPAFNDVPS